MKLLTPSKELAAIVGKAPLPRTEVVKKVWDHIRAHSLQDPADKRTILADWGPETLSANQARDLLEIIEDRMDLGSIIITSQVPVDRWHEMIGIPTIADAILDRLVHNAYRIELKGESLREQRKLDPI